MIERIPPVILVGIGGLFGAISRYLVSGFFKNYVDFPLGTLVVNVLGSFLLSYMVTLNRMNLFDPTWLIFLGTGFMGSFTTMSTFVVETMSFSGSSLKTGAFNLLITLIMVFLGGFLGQAVAVQQIRRIL
ncbi:MAG: CrcB family protein [Methanobacteriota archaeon]|nr:MAG: CrcB family protein [Euryarchaeota archaeon]